MAIANYPNSIADLISPDGQKLLGDTAQLHSSIETQQNLEIEAIENELGLGLKGSLSSLADRLNVSLNSNGTLKAEGVTIESLSDVTMLSALSNNQYLKYDTNLQQWINSTLLHNSILGLQGGTSGSYYHLTDSEYVGSGSGVFARVNSPTFITSIVTPSIVFNENLSFIYNDGIELTTNITFTTAGNLGIGTLTPTAYLHLKTGTSVASGAPLKFNSGSLLSSPEVGALEFLTNKLYFTTTSNTRRKTIAFDQEELVVVTNSYTTLDIDKNIICNSTSNFTVTLPSATGSGKTYNIKNINTGIITVDGESGNTIDGETSQTLNQWDSMQVLDYSGNVWVII